MFVTLDFSIVNAVTCAHLCMEMPRCSGFTFRNGAEEHNKGKSTEAGQCRFKENIKASGENANRDTYIKHVEEEEEEAEEAEAEEEEAEAEEEAREDKFAVLKISAETNADLF